MNKLEVDYKNEKKQDFFSIFLAITIIWLIVFNMVIPSFVYRRIDVVGNSMYPTLDGASKEYVDTKYYHAKDVVGVLLTTKIKRGDIVVFDPGIEGQKDYYIKRVIAIAGDIVYFQEIDQNYYLCIEKSINGGLVKEIFFEENYIFEKDYIKGNESLFFTPRVINEGEFFAMGDNRNHSSDSRYYTHNFKVKNIVGVVKCIYKPTKYELSIFGIDLFSYYSTQRVVNPFD